MNRLQKKCLIGSAVLHGLLGVVLLVAPGFLSKRQPESPPALTFIPRHVLDSTLSGGGSPAGAPPPPAARIEQSLPTPPSPPPQPVAKVEPPPKSPPPEPPKPAVKDTILPAPSVKKTVAKPVVTDPPPKVQKQSTKTTPEKSRFNFDKATTKKPSDNKRDTDKKKAVATEEHDTAATAQAQARAKALAGLKSSVKSLQSNLSSPVSAEPLGPGGEAYANYDQVIVSIYKNAWVIPDDAADELVVKVTISLARDGTVLSARISEPSRDGSLNKSVQRTLNNIKRVPEFPPGAKESQRGYKLEFSPKAKRALG